MENTKIRPWGGHTVLHFLQNVVARTGREKELNHFLLLEKDFNISAKNTETGRIRYSVQNRLKGFFVGKELEPMTQL